jgi:ribosomal protein S18 acetylase RimI-like enzyme
MNEEVVISDAEPEDALEINHLYYKAWLKTYPNEKVGITVDDIEHSYKDEFTAEKIDNLKKIIKELPKNKKRLLAKIGDKIVGSCVVSIEEETNSLVTIYVLPGYEGRGIGTKMWSVARNFLDKNKDTIVTVADYTNAVHFYKKLGFVETGKRIVDDKHKMKSGNIIPEIEMKLDKSLI